MKKVTAKKLLAQADEAETILDNMANEFDLDCLPKDVNEALEIAWKAAQAARIITQKWVDSLP